MYPETVRQAVEDFMPDDGILSKIHTHKVPLVPHANQIIAYAKETAQLISVFVATQNVLFLFFVNPKF